MRNYTTPRLDIGFCLISLHYSWEPMDVDIHTTVSENKKREMEKVETQYARNRVNT